MAARKRGELLGLLRSCFARPEPWLQAGKYVSALASGMPERNGWTIARQAGDRTPLRTQRLLNRAVWDTFAAMGVVRRFVVAGLDEAARRGGRRRGLRVGAIDETSQVKQGTVTAGVKRHYLGCVGKVANGITTVHLSYARERIGHALIGTRQWVPAGHIDDPVKEDFEFGKECFGLDQSQVRLHTAIARHTVLVMAALAICASTAALLRDRTDTQAPPPLTPDQPPPDDPGMVPLTVPQVKHLLAAVATGRPPGHADRWLDWTRRHQARSRWYHQRTRLARDTALAPVS